ncbi:DUF1707 domain-containing protein [Modestobacter sp. NPDC049651]|uniref:DUF1707 domain-containing protein n=1 Tax=unclassified Modestobacter TaxID=2643866 RepID=UPI0034013A1A
MSADHPDRPATPVVRASDAEREVVVGRLQAAVGEGRLTLDEFGERVEAAYAAGTTAELDALLADLPRPELVGRPAAELVGDGATGPLTTVFGDVVLAVSTGVPERVATVFGDVRIDLRGLRTAADVVALQLSSVFGDVEVIVGEGVAAELSGRTVFGDRKVQLAAVPRLAGTPRVVVTARSVFGDLKLRSLAPGESPSRWRAVLDRLAGRVPPPVPPAPPAPPSLP